MQVTNTGYVLQERVYETLMVENLEQADEIVRFLGENFLEPMRRLSTDRFAFTVLEIVDDDRDFTKCAAHFCINGAPCVLDLGTNTYPSGMADRAIVEIFLSAFNAILTRHAIPEVFGIVEGDPPRGSGRACLRLVLLPRDVAIALAKDPASSWHLPTSVAQLTSTTVDVDHGPPPRLPSVDELVPQTRLLVTEGDFESGRDLEVLFADLLSLLAPNPGIVVVDCSDGGDHNWVVRIAASGKEWSARFDVRRFIGFEVVDHLNASLAAIGSEERFCVLKSDDETVRFAVASPAERQQLEIEHLLENRGA